MLEQLVSDKDTFRGTEQSVESRLKYSIPVWLNVKSDCVPAIYERIWNLVREYGTSQYCETRVVSQLFTASRLPVETLGYLWAIGNLKSPGCLTQQELYIMLALIALVQNNYMVDDISILQQVENPVIPQLDYSVLQNRFIASFDPKELWEKHFANKNCDPNDFYTDYESLSLNFLGVYDRKSNFCHSEKAGFEEARKKPSLQVSAKLSTLNAHHRRVRQVVNSIRYKLPPIVEMNCGHSTSSEEQSPNRANRTINAIAASVDTSTVTNPRVPFPDDDLFEVSFAGPSKYTLSNADGSFKAKSNYLSETGVGFMNNVNVDLISTTGFTKDADRNRNYLIAAVPSASGVSGEDKESFEDEDEFSEFQSAVIPTDDEYTDFQYVQPAMPGLNPSAFYCNSNSNNSNSNNNDSDDNSNSDFVQNARTHLSSSSICYTFEPVKRESDTFIISTEPILDGSGQNNNFASSLVVTEEENETNSAKYSFDPVLENKLYELNVSPPDNTWDEWESSSNGVKTEQFLSANEQNVNTCSPTNAATIARAISADEQSVSSLQFDPVSNVSLSVSGAPAGGSDRYEALRSLEVKNDVIHDYEQTPVTDNDDDFGDFVTADVFTDSLPPVEINHSLQVKCLEACIRLLEEGADIFQRVKDKVNGENRFSEVFTDNRASRYFNQLKIVYETSQRLCNHFGTPVICDKLDKAWNNINKYSQYIIPVELSNVEMNVPSDGQLEICNICKTECSTNIAHLGVIAYHLTCINLFLHFVDNANIADALRKD